MTLGDERRLGRSLGSLATRAWMGGDADRALELGQRALAIAIRLNDVSLQTSVNYLLGRRAETRGDYRQGAQILSRVGETLQGDRRDELLLTGASHGSVGSRAQLAWCLAELGKFAGAMACSEEALRIARKVDQPGSLVFAYRSLGFISLRRGAIPQAIPPLERAVELCRVAEVRVFFDTTAADPPDLESAEGHYYQALARADELGMRPLAAHCHLGLGMLFHRTGDRAKAAEHLTTAATRYHQMDMVFWLVKAEAELGSPLKTLP